MKLNQNINTLFFIGLFLFSIILPSVVSAEEKVMNYFSRKLPMYQVQLEKSSQFISINGFYSSPRAGLNLESILYNFSYHLIPDTPLIYLRHMSQ